MTEHADPRHVAYVEVRDRGLDALWKGQVRRACRGLERACQLAEATQDANTVDQAEVNLAMARVQAHEDDLAEKGLREVLMRSSDDDVIRLASHCLAKVLSHRHQHDQALRYAKISHERATALGEPLKVHAALTLFGSIYLNQSRLEESLEHYEKALAYLEAEPLSDAGQQGCYWVMATDYVGYVLVLMDRLEEGKLRLEAAHERARMLGITDMAAETAMDLCFGHLRANELMQARAYGEEALAIGERENMRLIRRNCHYLLGEIASRLGEEAKADHHFQCLAEFYPGLSGIGSFLKAFDISSMINLKDLY